MSNIKKQVIVIGAGIVGSSIAYHLSKANFQVTIIEKDQPAAAATGSAFGWITAAVADDAPDVFLRKNAIQDWQRIEQEIPELNILWNGSIKYTTDAENVLPDEQIITQTEMATREPNLHNPPLSARYMPVDGAIEAKDAVKLLLQYASQHGAKLITQTSVTALLQAHGKVIGIATSQGQMTADYVILACGTEIPTLLSPLDLHLPILSSPAILLRFKQPSQVVNSILSGDDFEVRYSQNGDLVAAEDYVSGKSLADIANEAQALIQDGLDHTASIALQHSSIGYRPIPEDGHPMIGFIDPAQTLYIAVMHPAVTCAAIIGRLVCEELMTNTQPMCLTNYSPSRFKQ